MDINKLFWTYKVEHNEDKNYLNIQNYNGESIGKTNDREIAFNIVKEHNAIVLELIKHYNMTMKDDFNLVKFVDDVTGIGFALCCISEKNKEFAEQSSNKIENFLEYI